MKTTATATRIGSVVMSGFTVSVFRIECKPTRYVGKCGGCKRTISALKTAEIRIGCRQYAEGDKASHVLSSGCVYVPCCGRDRELKPVRGIFSAVHECGARCMGSKGPTCECSCGGANHGASFG